MVADMTLSTHTILAYLSVESLQKCNLVISFLGDTLVYHFIFTIVHGLLWFQRPVGITFNFASLSQSGAVKTV